MLLEKLRGLFNTGKSTLSCGINAERIVDVSRSVKRETDKKIVFGKEFCPFLINDIAVGLNGVVNRDLVYVVLLLKLEKLAVEVKPRKGRLSALKGEGSRAACIFKCFSDQILCRY